jgi:hypothetical protein
MLAAMKLPWKRARGTDSVPADAAIRTSQPGWFESLARAYRDRVPVRLVDDAKVGIDPRTQSLAAMGIHARLGPAEWAAVGVALGVSAAGMVMVVLAFLDPEPTSKLGLLVGGGAVCVLSGGLSAVAVLSRRKPPTIELGRDGFRIRWE